MHSRNSGTWPMRVSKTSYLCFFSVPTQLFILIGELCESSFGSVIMTVIFMAISSIHVKLIKPWNARELGDT